MHLGHMMATTAEQKHLEAQRQMVDTARLYSKSGQAYAATGNMYQAHEMHLKSAQIFVKQGLLADAAVQYFCIATAASHHTEQSLTALKYYRKAAKCYHKIGMVKVAAELYNRVADLYFEAVSPEALPYYALADSLLGGDQVIQAKIALCRAREK